MRVSLTSPCVSSRRLTEGRSRRPGSRHGSRPWRLSARITSAARQTAPFRFVPPSATRFPTTAWSRSEFCDAGRMGETFFDLIAEGDEANPVLWIEARQEGSGRLRRGLDALAVHAGRGVQHDHGGRLALGGHELIDDRLGHLGVRQIVGRTVRGEAEGSVPFSRFNVVPRASVSDSGRRKNVSALACVASDSKKSRNSRAASASPGLPNPTGPECSRGDRSRTFPSCGNTKASGQRSSLACSWLKRTVPSSKAAETMQETGAP